MINCFHLLRVAKKTRGKTEATRAPHLLDAFKVTTREKLERKNASFCTSAAIREVLSKVTSYPFLEAMCSLAFFFKSRKVYLSELAIG